MSITSPLVDNAADGRLPAWAEMSDKRFGHVERVAALMGEWAQLLQLPHEEVRRWRAAGYLHDALREQPPEELRPFVAEPLHSVVGKLLHGPAAAARLRAEGVHDDPLLRAITYHTIGHPELDELGRALFIADYIEPGRRYDVDLLADLRARMPHDRANVLREVLRARLTRLIHENRPIRPETAAFWNSLAAPASPRDAGA